KAGDAMSGVSMFEPTRVAELLEAQGASIRAELHALPSDLRVWPPADGEWCANEVLGHMIEAERRGFNGRIRRILAEERPALPGWDEKAVATERRDREQDPFALL